MQSTVCGYEYVCIVSVGKVNRLASNSTLNVHVVPSESQREKLTRFGPYRFYHILVAHQSIVLVIWNNLIIEIEE